MCRICDNKGFFIFLFSKFMAKFTPIFNDYLITKSTDFAILKVSINKWLFSLLILLFDVCINIL